MTKQHDESLTFLVALMARGNTKRKVNFSERRQQAEQSSQDLTEEFDNEGSVLDLNTLYLQHCSSIKMPSRNDINRKLLEVLNWMRSEDLYRSDIKDWTYVLNTPKRDEYMGFSILYCVDEALATALRTDEKIQDMLRLTIENGKEREEVYIVADSFLFQYPLVGDNLSSLVVEGLRDNDGSVDEAKKLLSLFQKDVMTNVVSRERVLLYATYDKERLGALRAVQLLRSYVLPSGTSMRIKHTYHR